METKISISHDLFAQVEQVATKRGVSVTDFVRESLHAALAQNGNIDPMFADNAVWTGDGPSDVSVNHDDYLYGDPH